MDDRYFVPGAIVPVPGVRRADLGPAAFDAAATGPAGTLHDPPLQPRDEAVFLLSAAAEIEHALMVQYLYAAYSVRVVDGDPHRPALATVRDRILQIAREEMGHLATVENLLHLVGEPPRLERVQSPYTGSIHPFRFTLEPLTPGSLSKYVTAESPDPLPGDLSGDDKQLVQQLREDAAVANRGQRVRHVGRIFERLATLFGDAESGLRDDDILLDAPAFQASFQDWGFTPRRQSEGDALIVSSFAGTDTAAVREAAVTAIRGIGAQGEGFDPAPTGTESHFERFLDLYKKVKDLSSAGASITWQVATNPNTTSEPVQPATDELAVAVARAESTGRIDHPIARAWAHLFNLRYRLLLGQFAHFLRLGHELYVDDPGPRQGDRTDRGLLLSWAFDEMRHLRKIATKLAQLPKDDPPGPERAGPPFELPYTLTLPDGERQRWRVHLDVLRAAERLVNDRLPTEIGGDGFLADLMRADAKARRILESLARDGSVPADSLPAGFAKVVTILEEAVRGFSIGATHQSFWTGRTRDQLLAPDADPQLVLLDQNGQVEPDPDHAPLVNRLEGTTPPRMPMIRPAVAAPRIAFIRRWIAAGAPDDDPPGRVGIEHERDPRL